MGCHFSRSPAPPRQFLLRQWGCHQPPPWHLRALCELKRPGEGIGRQRQQRRSTSLRTYASWLSIVRKQAQVAEADVLQSILRNFAAIVKIFEPPFLVDCKSVGVVATIEVESASLLVKLNGRSHVDYGTCIQSCAASCVLSVVVAPGWKTHTPAECKMIEGKRFCKNAQNVMNDVH